MPPIKPVQPKINYRTASVRAMDGNEPGFDGHASTFWVVDDYLTAMKPGAFRKTLRERGDRIPLLWQHDPYTPIGKPTELKEDKTGLSFKADVVTDTRAGSEAMALLRAETPLGMSFGFQTIKSRPYEEADDEHLDWSSAPVWAKGGKDKDAREWLTIIEEVRLWEISLVTFPANESAAISSIRQTADLDFLNSLLASMRAGSLTDEQASLIEQLVAEHDAQRAAAEAERLTALKAERSQRDRDIALAIALATQRGQGVMTP